MGGCLIGPNPFGKLLFFFASARALSRMCRAPRHVEGLENVPEKPVFKIKQHKKENDLLKVSALLGSFSMFPFLELSLILF